MEMLKKFTFFIITYNVIFILMLNIQYIYRFNGSNDLIAKIMYSSILSIYFSIIPLVCFVFSWIVYKFLFKKLQISSLLKSALLLLITVTLTYLSIKIIEQDPFLSVIMVSSTILTLILFFYIYRNNGDFTNKISTYG
jgi:hypothetical protein